MLHAVVARQTRVQWLPGSCRAADAHRCEQNREVEHVGQGMEIAARIIMR